MSTKNYIKGVKKMKKVTGHKHMCVNIRGMLNHFVRKSMACLIVDKGR